MSLTRILPSMIDSTAASDGDALVYSSANARFEFGAVAATGLDVIRTPIVTSPSANATISNFTPEIVGTAYASVYSVDARNYRQFQVDVAAGDFSTPVADEQANSDSRTLVTTLDPDVAYKVRIRDVATTGLASEYSNAVSFSTPGVIVNAPTLTVEGTPSSVNKTPTLTTSAFSTTPAEGDMHAATDWEVRKTSDNSLVYSSLNDETNLLSIKVPTGNLEVSTEYLFRARHIGTTYGAGPYIEVTATTVAQFEVVPLLAVAHNIVSASGVVVYDQNIDTFTKLSTPTTTGAVTGRGIQFSHDDTYVAFSRTGTPFIEIHKRSFGTFTKLANPSVLPTGSTPGTVSWGFNSTYLAMPGDATPFIHIYKRSNDTFTKLPNPSSLPPSVGFSTAFSPDGTLLAVGHQNSPFITLYSRSGDTFTKLGNPSGLPTDSVRGTPAFSHDNTYLAVPSDATPFISIYKNNGANGFSKLANPAVIPSARGWGAAFSSDALYLAVATESGLFIYKRSGDTFTKLADPVGLVGASSAVAFSSDDLYLAAGHFASPFVAIYKRSGDTFTKLANPNILPEARVYQVHFSNTGFPQ